MKNFRSLLIAITGLLFASTMINAQDTIQADSFSVALAEFVITGQFEPTHYKKAIHKVGVISSKEIESRGARTLDEAIIINPAVRIYQDPVLGTSLGMRGIGSSNVAILQDGVPVIGRVDGAIDISQISMHNVERIEVVQGALSNLYGSNAAGGVINIITKNTPSSKWSLGLNSQLESIGKQNHDANIGFNYKKFNALIHARFMRYHQYSIDELREVEEIALPSGGTRSQVKYPFNPKNQYAVGGVLGFRPDKSSTIKLRYDFGQEKVSDYGVKKRPQFKPYADDRFYETKRSDISIDFKKSWDNFFIKLTSAYNYFNRHTEDKRYYIETSTFDSLQNSTTETLFASFFNKAIASYKVNKDFSSTLGVNYTFAKGSGDKIVNKNSADSSTITSYEIAPFLELKYKGIKNLTASTSARLTIHNLYSSKLTPSVHLKYKVKEKVTLRLGYSQGYRSPSLKELYLEFIDVNHNIIGKEDLSPETSHDLQFTIDYNPLKSLSLSFNAYNTIIQDKIGLIEYETLKYEYENLNNYQVLGFQPSVRFLHNGLVLQTSSSLGFWSTQIDSEMTPAYGKAFDMNNLISYKIEKLDLGITINHRYVGSHPNYFIDGDDIRVNTRSAYQLLDASLERSFFKDKFHVVVGVKNLLDIDTVPVSSSSLGSTTHGTSGRSLINQGRNWFTSLRLSL